MPPPKKATIHLRWLLLLPIPLLWALADQFGYLRLWENQTVDIRTRWRGEMAAPVKLVYVDVDTAATEAIGERPWSRALFADVTEALLTEGKARVIGLDFVFSKISTSGLVDQHKALAGNARLRDVLLAHPRDVVLAAQYTEGLALTQRDEAIRQIPLLRKGNTDPSKNDLPEMPDNGFVLGPHGPIGQVGLIDVDVEYSGDATPRWVPLFVHTVNPTVYHLSLELVLRQLGLDESAVKIVGSRMELVKPDGKVAISIPLTEGQLLEINWFSRWKNETLNPRVSFAEVIDAIRLTNSAKAEDQQAAKEFFAQFKDAIVLVGPTDPLLQDLAPTPFDSYPVPKVGLHGNLVKTILSQRFVVRLPQVATWVAVLGLTAVVTVLALVGGVRSVAAKVGAVAILGGYVVGAQLLFSRLGLVLPLCAPLGAAFTTSFLAVIGQLVVEEKQKGRIKGLFGTYLAPTVVDQIIDSGKDPELGGHDVEITAYFSDIQNFSAFSEVMPSVKLGELLNEYLTACTDIVQAERGTLDKYIGDAVVAMFGAPVNEPDHALRACVASQLVQRRLRALREKWKSDGEKWPTLVHHLRTRIGLNSGVCMIGNMGSRVRFNYTMMGDNVNLAARMESGAKGWGVYSMCTESTKRACDSARADRVVFRALGRTQVVGRSQPVPIFEIVGLDEDVTEQARECIQVFETGLAKYLERDWAGAIRCFDRSLALEWNRPGADGVITNPSIVYRDLVRLNEANPPPAEWDGRLVMKEK